MAYRRHAEHRESTTVVHGPFPVGWLRPLVVVLLLGFGVMAFGSAYGRRTLVCSAAEDRCELTTRWSRESLKSFRWSELESVRVTESKRHKQAPSAYLVLVIAGRDWPLRSTHPRQATEFVAALKADRTQSVRAELTGPPLGYLLAGALALAAAALMRSVIRQRSAVRVVVERHAPQLLVRRGVSWRAGRGHLVSVDGTCDVQVEWTHKPSLSTHRHHPGATCGRLVLVGREGARTPLTEDFYPGFTVHRRAASELRNALGLDPMSDAELQREQAQAELFRPPPSGLQGNRFAAVWLGASVGSLLGMLLAAGLLVAIGAITQKQPPDTGFVLVGAAAGALLGGIWMWKRAASPADPA